MDAVLLTVYWGVHFDQPELSVDQNSFPMDLERISHLAKRGQKEDLKPVLMMDGLM